MRVEKLYSYEENQLRNLKDVIRRYQPGEGFVFEAKIPENPKIHQLTAQRKAVAAHLSEARVWFTSICRELERRIHP